MKLEKAENWEGFMSYKPAPPAASAAPRYSTPPFSDALSLGMAVSVAGETPLVAVSVDVQNLWE
eukprot:1239429-Pleurochrysis_carterae.AAC.1